MPVTYGDIETFSNRTLKECGAHVYATDATTGVHFLCFAIDDGPVQVWRPGDPVPAPFVNPADFKFISDNWTFECTVHQQFWSCATSSRRSRSKTKTARSA